MELYFLEPEVAGGHGEKTIYEKNATNLSISEKVKYLHYEFQGWLGDDLLESTPTFIISKMLKTELIKSEFKDYKLDKCLTTLSENFEEMYPSREIPSFDRFIPLGTIEIEKETYKNWSGHNFCLSLKGDLVVTQKALDFLGKFSIKNCDITVLTKSEY